MDMYKNNASLEFEAHGYKIETYIIIIFNTFYNLYISVQMDYSYILYFLQTFILKMHYLHYCSILKMKIRRIGEKFKMHEC